MALFLSVLEHMTTRPDIKTTLKDKYKK